LTPRADSAPTRVAKHGENDGVSRRTTRQQVGSIEPFGDDSCFRVWTGDSAEVGTFAFHNERTARRAARLIQEIIAQAIAVFGAEQLLG